jgi:hypothetical protein
MRKAWHIAQMGERGCAKWFLVEKPGGWRPLEDLGLYGWITLKRIFRLIQIVHMASGEESRKNEPMNSLMDYTLSSKCESKKMANHSIILIHSHIRLFSSVPQQFPRSVPN